ncbi:hypothetical protein [Mycobacterium sp. PSTR-4-N]|uniref:hypothetical protein n=1 Tax=Mycobacterium sp. PSTR-4-N TaxID=2917745 RepID=UPI001F15229B|nr:hypothetical protein [Mycobacterium sp. PSTR-4-N]MCG7595802.1 hypothetical protein [Mycobacterium sp. PSTR-4-N]
MRHHEPHDQARQDEGYGDSGADSGTVTIDCDDCAVRGPGCQDCVVSVLLGIPENLLVDEQRALEVLADVGLAPRLRLVPLHRRGTPGVA